MHIHEQFKYYQQLITNNTSLAFGFSAWSKNTIPKFILSDFLSYRHFSGYGSMINSHELGMLNRLFLEKIEELTLYMLDQQRTIQNLIYKVNTLKNKK